MKIIKYANENNVLNGENIRLFDNLVVEFNENWECVSLL